MQRFFLSIILGFYLMVCLEDMSMAVDIPAPIFQQPSDPATPLAPQYSKPADGAVPGQAFPAPTATKNLLTCATAALADKFPFDFFGVFDSDAGSASVRCPRIVMFENTSASVSFEMCFILNTIALLKYPLLIGLAISVIIAL